MSVGIAKAHDNDDHLDSTICTVDGSLIAADLAPFPDGRLREWPNQRQVSTQLEQLGKKVRSLEEKQHLRQRCVDLEFEQLRQRCVDVEELASDMRGGRRTAAELEELRGNMREWQRELEAVKKFLSTEHRRCLEDLADTLRSEVQDNLQEHARNLDMRMKHEVAQVTEQIDERVGAAEHRTSLKKLEGDIVNVQERFNGQLQKFGDEHHSAMCDQTHSLDERMTADLARLSRLVDDRVVSSVHRKDVAELDTKLRIELTTFHNIHETKHAAANKVHRKHKAEISGQLTQCSDELRSTLQETARSLSEWMEMELARVSERLDDHITSSGQKHALDVDEQRSALQQGSRSLEEKMEVELVRASERICEFEASLGHRQAWEERDDSLRKEITDLSNLFSSEHASTRGILSKHMLDSNVRFAQVNDEYTSLLHATHAEQRCLLQETAHGCEEIRNGLAAAQSFEEATKREVACVAEQLERRVLDAEHQRSLEELASAMRSQFTGALDALFVDVQQHVSQEIDALSIDERLTGLKRSLASQVQLSLGHRDRLEQLSDHDSCSPAWQRLPTRALCGPGGAAEDGERDEAMNATAPVPSPDDAAGVVPFARWG